jgi:hypothetical protein
MKALRFIALAFSIALAVSLYLAIGEEPTPLFLTVGFFYASIATLALVLSFIAEEVNR